MTMVYKETDDKHIRLKNFMEIDMQPFINEKLFDFKSNPFHTEKQDQFKYKLTSLIVYSNSHPCRDSYSTYVRQKDSTWMKYSK
jgi:hypothetical protein